MRKQTGREAIEAIRALESSALEDGRDALEALYRSAIALAEASAREAETWRRRAAVAIAERNEAEAWEDRALRRYRRLKKKLAKEWAITESDQ